MLVISYHNSKEKSKIKPNMSGGLVTLSTSVTYTASVCLLIEISCHIDPNDNYSNKIKMQSEPDKT
jgi:hypothetical protein